MIRTRILILNDKEESQLLQIHCEQEPFHTFIRRLQNAYQRESHQLPITDDDVDHIKYHAFDYFEAPRWQSLLKAIFERTLGPHLGPLDHTPDHDRVWDEYIDDVRTDEQLRKAKVSSMTEGFMLFVDMLGFADLVEQGAASIQYVRPVLANASVELSDSELVGEGLPGRFASFHKCLNTVHEGLNKQPFARMIVFSDSAFFFVSSVGRALRTARDLMHNLLTLGVPARMGVAHGSFHSVRHASDTSSVLSTHVSQFLGTAVVRAYRAERCGAPGCRIFLHPNVDQHLDPDSLTLKHIGIVAVEPMPSRLPVTYEVNYLRKYSTHESQGADIHDSWLNTQLQWLRDASDAAYYHHYDATFAALNKMRLQYGGKDNFHYEPRT